MQTGLSGGLERPVTAKTTQSGTGRSFKSGTWNEPNVVIHEESPTFEEAVDWLGGVRSGSTQESSNNYRRKSLTRSRGSGGSGESDGPPAFL